MFNSHTIPRFSIFMAEKKVTKKVVKKVVKKVTTKAKKTTKASKSKVKKINDEPSDGGIVIVDDDIVIDQDKVNEERRAYLEEARSQEAVD